MGTIASHNLPESAPSRGNNEEGSRDERTGKGKREGEEGGGEREGMRDRKDDRQEEQAHTHARTDAEQFPSAPSQPCSPTRLRPFSPQPPPVSVLRMYVR